MTKVERWSKEEKKRILVDQPQIIQDYNQFMELVDMVDQMVKNNSPIFCKQNAVPHFFLGML